MRQRAKRAAALRSAGCQVQRPLAGARGDVSAGLPSCVAYAWIARNSSPAQAHATHGHAGERGGRLGRFNARDRPAVRSACASAYSQSARTGQISHRGVDTLHVCFPCCRSSRWASISQSQSGTTCGDAASTTLLYVLE